MPMLIPMLMISALGAGAYLLMRPSSTLSKIKTTSNRTTFGRHLLAIERQPDGRVRWGVFARAIVDAAGGDLAMASDRGGLLGRGVTKGETDARNAAKAWSLRMSKPLAVGHTLELTDATTPIAWRISVQRTQSGKLPSSYKGTLSAAGSLTTEATSEADTLDAAIGELYAALVDVPAPDAPLPGPTTPLVVLAVAACNTEPLVCATVTSTSGGAKLKAITNDKGIEVFLEAAALPTNVVVALDHKPNDVMAGAGNEGTAQASSGLDYLFAVRRYSDPASSDGWSALVSAVRVLSASSTRNIPVRIYVVPKA